MFYGEGGFDFIALYTMPVNLRTYYYLKVADVIEQRNEQQKQQNEQASRRGGRR
jgi:hypothetical protein